MNPKEKREALRRELREKRDAMRRRVLPEAVKRAMRSVRTSAMCCAVAVLLAGCNSMVPSSGSNRASYDGCTATVSIYIGTTTNQPSGVVCAVPMEIHITDLLGTQSCSSEGTTTDQKAGQTLTPGLTGDKPIEEVGKIAAAGLTGGGSSVGALVGDALDAAMDPAAVAVPAGPATAPPVATPAGPCADGTCSVAPL